jgi:glycosyltransferase involved in cell wall biosynthesis
VSKRLLFDLVTVTAGKSAIHGGGVYGLELFRALRLSDNPILNEWEIEAALPADPETRRTVEEYLADCSLAPTHELSSLGEVVALLESGRFELGFTAMPYDYHKHFDRIRAMPVAFVGVLHGLRALEVHPDSYYRWLVRNPLVKARLLFGAAFPRHRERSVEERLGKLVRSFGPPIVTDCLHSKYHILSRFADVEARDIRIITPLIQHPNTTAPEPRALGAPASGVNQQSHCLMLSCNRPVKNAIRVLEAFERYMRDDRRPPLVCVGFTPEQEKRVKKSFPKTSKTTRFLRYLDSDELNRLIVDAACLLFPSLSEGYGYPPLEAMRFGTPAIVAATSSLMESTGGAALYCDPHNSWEIAARIQALLYEPGLREHLVRRGLERAGSYMEEANSVPEQFAELLETLS